MTKVINLSLIAKANRVKPLINFETIMRKFFPAIQFCSFCRQPVKRKQKSAYGTFCSSTCKHEYFDHYVRPEIEARREDERSSHVD
ncbi:hypothetical protein [Pedobacter sp. SYP-B3415]|uniref:hypothetical protein n=1 Tax=Pedobacter sp. SYP-B3415 TaxID=2496641 RepID=UPI00101BEE4F|nr:hypothetical protein [Pedobacter sp. SYP-B3415]